MAIVKTTNLHNTTNGRDAIYIVEIEESNKPGWYFVNYQNGRRGSSLASGTKTADAVQLDEAEKIHDKVVKDKMKGGYKITGSQQSTVQSVQNDTDTQKAFNEMLPQLSNPCKEEDLDFYLDSDEWVMQQKMDGERRPIYTNFGSVAVGFNRDGQITPLPLTLIESLKDPAFNSTSLDGEIVGDTYYVFDITAHGSFNELSKWSLESRLEELKKIFNDAAQYSNVLLCQTYIGREAKRKAFEEIKAAGLEGVIFKRLAAAYMPGRPNSKGDSIKYKFLDDATVIVIGARKGKRSVSIAVRDITGNLIEVGNVTIPANKTVPEVNDLIDVSFLYYYEGGSLFQPVYGKERKDKQFPDFVHTLKVKPLEQVQI